MFVRLVAASRQFFLNKIFTEKHMIAWLTSKSNFFSFSGTWFLRELLRLRWERFCVRTRPELFFNSKVNFSVSKTCPSVYVYVFDLPVFVFCIVNGANLSFASASKSSFSLFLCK